MGRNSATPLLRWRVHWEVETPRENQTLVTQTNNSNMFELFSIMKTNIKDVTTWEVYRGTHKNNWTMCVKTETTDVKKEITKNKPSNGRQPKLFKQMNL